MLALVPQWVPVAMLETLADLWAANKNKTWWLSARIPSHISLAATYFLPSNKEPVQSRYKKEHAAVGPLNGVSQSFGSLQQVVKRHRLYRCKRLTQGFGGQ
ncbi:hypothetical protein, variant [Blastomyces gilchristii SLH14081]|uniref:Uncharacterized protein n=1 Tax=Blastomyces gilchristii (strain SLH14081) TaxID=559298 RepID=A0A179UP46_BLAGS|nr:uncharacterized protein BDBG_04579 [Blastomyces gilchristii SLH14081]XP_031578592.1 hypothetical protein, variant [Blastomyces gilchristii SLH14081]OAT08997.1 hypothetical protein BDBG_04579 [Blastomyces gilchristii SLH14081]OAT08998.1 hypothetical protein, variant [Blastomyces gilchristii SLH14081]